MASKRKSAKKNLKARRRRARKAFADGRTLGLVYETDIKARAGVILWPVNRMFRGR